jgi:hypothetical protein
MLEVKKGTRVKVVSQDSVFTGMEGRIEEVRLSPLPLGVRIRKGRALVWFDREELEIILQVTQKIIS